MKKALNGNGLRREIGLSSATILVIANMIGTGIFTTSGYVMGELGDARALLPCWLCGGLFALFGALCYGELGARFPMAGGEYVFLRECFGKPMGFLSGWVSLIVGFSAPIAAAGIAFATYLFQAFSIPEGGAIAFRMFGVSLAVFSPVSLAAVLVIVLFSLIHYHSLRIGSRVQNFLTLFKILLILLFSVAGFWLGDGSFTHFQETPGGDASLSPEAFAVALIFISFAYSGWNAAAYLGSEIRNPQRNIPRALYMGTAVVILLYLLLNAVYLYAIPPEEMSGAVDIGARAAVFLFGEKFSRVFSGCVALGILSVLSAMIVTGPRVYYAMARDNIFFPVFGKLNRTRYTPASSIFFQAAIASVMVFTASFDTLLVYIGFTLSVFASLTVTGLMILRRRTGGKGGGYKTPGYPVVPLVFILCNVWIIVHSLKSRPAAALIGLCTIAVGGVAYVFFRRVLLSDPREPVLKTSPDVVENVRKDNE